MGKIDIKSATMITGEGFRKYLSACLSKSLSENSINSYLSYLHKCNDTKLQSLSLGQSLLETLCDKCNSTSSGTERIDIVQKYISECSEILSDQNHSKANDKKNISNIRSALKRFLEYIVFINRNDTDRRVKKDDSCCVPSNWRSHNDNQIDGMSILLDRFPDLKHFIEFVLSGCYFFSPKDVKERHDVILNHILGRKAIPARYSTDIRFYNNRRDVRRGVKNVIYNDGTSGDILIDIDSNGNAAVDQLFSLITRRYLKGTKSRNPDFINLKISHIWGRASAPRFFTNLWNIVLVPSFANDILDKPSSQDGSYNLGAVFLNTLKCVLCEYYRLDLLDWQNMNLDAPTYISEKVICGTYKINVFEAVENEEIPKIKQVEVFI